MRRALLFAVVCVCVSVSSPATAQDASVLCDRMDVRKLLGIGDQGSPLELFCLARAYGEGKGVPRNDQTSLKYLRKSAERGFPSAQLVMGLQYESGAPAMGIPKDKNEALKWYRLAAAQGDVIATDKVYQLSKAAAPSQPEEATFEQAKTLYNAKDFTGAARLLQKAALAGNVKAQSALGYQYEFGEGVPQNYAEAVKWYRKAAEGELDIAQVQLANMYYAGKGVAINDAEAFKWYQKAANQHNRNGYYGLGRAYEYGYGVTPDRQKALELFREAAKRGHVGGAEAARILSNSGNPIPPDGGRLRASSPAGPCTRRAMDNACWREGLFPSSGTYADHHAAVDRCMTMTAMRQCGKSLYELPP